MVVFSALPCTAVPFYGLQSPELLARLERLQDELETKEYNAIVKDVDKTAGGMPDPFMATFKEQAAFGEPFPANITRVLRLKSHVIQY